MARSALCTSVTTLQEIQLKGFIWARGFGGFSLWQASFIAMDDSWGRHHGAGSVSGIPSSSFLSYSLDLKPMGGWHCSHLAWGSPRVHHSNSSLNKQTKD